MEEQCSRGLGKLGIYDALAFLLLYILDLAIIIQMWTGLRADVNFEYSYHSWVVLRL